MVDEDCGKRCFVNVSKHNCMQLGGDGLLSSEGK